MSCDWAANGHTLAFHCIEKRPSCLNLSQCRCLTLSSNSWGRRATGRSRSRASLAGSPRDPTSQSNGRHAGPGLAFERSHT
eukprot:6028399-Prymnesium_polylepis.1